MRPHFPKKQAPVFFCALRSPFSFGGGDSSRNSQTADSILVFGLYWQIQVLSPVSPSQANFEQLSLNFRNMNLHHPTLTLSSSSVSECGIHSAHRFLTRRRLYNMDMVTAIPIRRLSWISWVVTLSLAQINLSAASMFVTATAFAGVPHRCPSLKLHLPHLNWPNQKQTWVLDGAFLPKSCFKFSRASLDVSPSHSHRTSWL